MENDADNDDEEFEVEPSHQNQRSAKKNIFTERLIGALDKCQVTDRNAMHLISAVIEALGLQLNDFVMNVTSIKEYRSKIRSSIADEVKQNVEVYGLKMRSMSHQDLTISHHCFSSFR